MAWGVDALLKPCDAPGADRIDWLRWLRKLGGKKSEALEGKAERAHPTAKFRCGIEPVFASRICPTAVQMVWLLPGASTTS